MNENLQLTDKKRTLIFVNIIISCIASSMLATALTTALPAIINDFHISVTMGQWLTSGYSLAMGIVMPLTAFLITRFPTKKLYISGIVFTILGLFLCVIAKSFPVLMGARILQALGNGILSSMAQVIILSIYPPEKRGSAMGWYGLSVGAAPVVAPTLAGILVDSLGWRSIFYIVIGIMVISLIYSFCVLADVLETVDKKFDVVSFVLSIFAFGGVTLGIGNAGTYPFVSFYVLGILIIGIAAAVIFAVRQLKISQPFLELRILKSRNYALSVIGSMLLYFVMMGSSILMPLYVQTICGYSATFSGLVVLPGSLVMAVISPFAGKIYDKIGIKPLFTAGAAAMVISTIGMCFINRSTTVWLAAVLNVIRSVSIGCLLMPLVTWGNDSIESKNTAHGTALLTSLRTVSGAIGTAVLVGVMNFAAGKFDQTIPEDAMMKGLNVSFMCMGIISAVLLAIAVFGISNNKNKKDSDISEENNPVPAE